MKLAAVTREEKRELKLWLTSLLPADLSRNDVADEFGVTRKTVSAMLNPDSTVFGNGLTMLRYLRLVGAVVDAPTESPASSRLAALEEQVAESNHLTRRALELLELLNAPPTAAAPPTRKRANG